MKHSSVLFPVTAISVSLLAYHFPYPWIEWKTAILPLLMLIMLGMGMTLNFKDFVHTWQRPAPIALGITLQYTIMPLLAFILSLAFQLPTELSLGVLLVGCSSGGTASNVICYLAKGNVPLSVSLTFCSSLLAIVALPALIWVFAGVYVPVDPIALFISVAKLVLLPILLGLLLNYYFARKIAPLKPFFPLFSMACIVIIIAIIVALNQANLQKLAGLIVVLVVLHNLLGILSAYGISRLFGQDRIVSRTLAIEVGMQNSGLSVALALEHFSKLAALPGALFSIWHNISGASLAAIWRRDRNSD